MTVMMTRDEIVRALVAQGVPGSKAEQIAANEKGESAPVADCLQVVGPSLDFPIRFTLPWSALCSDNEREKASLYMQGGKPVPRKVMGARYKTARSKVVAVARETMHGFPALALPLSIRARVHVPDERVHDVVNFAKGVHDALQGIVYVNDSWLHRALWERAGVDVDHPRAEITIEPLGSVR